MECMNKRMELQTAEEDQGLLSMIIRKGCQSPVFCCEDFQELRYFLPLKISELIWTDSNRASLEKIDYAIIN
jgi:hypothetical protein